jgi:hypothetical protein
LYLTAIDGGSVGFTGILTEPAGRTRHLISFCGGVEALNHHFSDQISDLLLHVSRVFCFKLSPFDLKCGFADFPLIGVRAAPDNKVILRPLEQNLAPERCKKYGCFKRSLRGGLFCVPQNYCRWLDEAGCVEKRGS